MENNSSFPVSTDYCDIQWQKDDQVLYCSHAPCKKQFSLWIRRHHCRWCGLIFCDNCTRHRVERRAGMILGPFTNTFSSSESLAFTDLMAGDKVRVCDHCFVQLSNSSFNRLRSPTSPPLSPHSNMRSRNQLPRRRFTTSGDFTNDGLESNTFDDDSSSSSAAVATNMNNFSHCPVCGLCLIRSNMTDADVESHLNECLNSGSSQNSTGVYFVSFILSEKFEGECSICFEDYEVGQEITRLNCLCLYHRECIEKWFEKGHKCPLHFS